MASRIEKLRTIAPSGGWRWITGEQWNSNSALWSAGEPNNQFGSEDYLLFRGNADCTWNDGRTDDVAPRGFLVEFESSCGDDRDTIIQEYATHNVTFYPGTTPQSSLPRCTDFTGGVSTLFYSFANLNTGDYADWAIIRSPVVIASSAGYGLDAWANHLGAGPVRPLNSVYRNPARNFARGGANRSRHMFGDAVDMRNMSRTSAEYDRLAFAAVLAQALRYGYIEPLSGPCGFACVHADWRNAPGAFVNP